MFFVRVAKNVYYYFLLVNYNGDPDSIEFDLHCLFALDSTLFNITIITFGSFFLRICDIQYAGIYITYLNSFSNFSRLYTSTIWLFLLEPLTFQTLAIVGTIFNIFYFFIIKDALILLQNSPKI